MVFHMTQELSLLWQHYVQYMHLLPTQICIMVIINREMECTTMYWGSTYAVCGLFIQQD